MSENFSSLFQYLKKENININQDEFEFQAQSHPDYPSLLAFSDTLSFFNILNGAIRVTSSEIELLPDRFVSFLKEKDGKRILNYIERKGDNYIYTKNSRKETLSKASLESTWNSVVLIVEKSEDLNEIKSKTNLFRVLSTLFLILFLVIILQFETNFKAKLFFLFPTLGALFSIAALKDLFGTKSELINSFCNITASTSCTTIIASAKWKIFDVVNFSDLSIVFFFSQFLSLLTFLFIDDVPAYFGIQKVILIFTIPVILLSLYFQKKVEKKWCPICLVIIGIILLELCYVFFIQQTTYEFLMHTILIFGFIFLTVTLIWSVLKKLLIQQKDLKNFQIKGNQFMRNYEIFKNTLLANDKTELALSPIILGNKESNLEISIITSPFCGYCKGAHEILEKILIANRDKLKITIIINADINSLDEEKRTFFRILMSIYIEKGENLFLEALNSWFTDKDIKKWIKKYETTTYDEEKIDSIYELQNQWCLKNNSYFTPSIFINDYSYPRIYERESLIFFVNDLLEDKFLSDNYKN